MAPLWMNTWLPLVVGLWMVWVGLSMETGNARSTLLIKVFPVITGVLSLFAGAVNIGWLPVVTG